ncbi:MAG: hypothetical protein ACREP9_05225, partial [Candidatus Dormibacteraceae bacterium]
GIVLHPFRFHVPPLRRRPNAPQRLDSAQGQSTPPKIRLTDAPTNHGANSHLRFAQAGSTAGALPSVPPNLRSGFDRHLRSLVASTRPPSLPCTTGTSHKSPI